MRNLKIFSIPISWQKCHLLSLCVQKGVKMSFQGICECLEFSCYPKSVAWLFDLTNRKFDGADNKSYITFSILSKSVLRYILFAIFHVRTPLCIMKSKKSIYVFISYRMKRQGKSNSSWFYYLNAIRIAAKLNLSCNQ